MGTTATGQPWRPSFPTDSLKLKLRQTGGKRWRLEAFNADVIVTDLAVPHTEGIQLLQRLKERGDVTPAVVLTAVGSMHKALPVADELKAFWLLEKPVEP